jgi:hypothetical protein
MNWGLDPTANVPVIFPSLGRSRVTVLLLELATQMDVPSKATLHWILPYSELSEQYPIACTQFCHGIRIAVVRHPDVFSPRQQNLRVHGGSGESA